MAASAPEILPVAPSSFTVTTADRHVIHGEGIEHFAVHVLCFHGEHVYLQRRGGRPPRNKHCLTSTASGHIDLGDCAEGGEAFVSVAAAERAARRELHEELEDLYGSSVVIDRHHPFFYAGRTLAPSRNAEGSDICIAQTFVFLVDLHAPLEFLEGHDEQGDLEVEAMHALTIAAVEAAVIGTASLDHPMADNFAAILSVARQAASTFVATRDLRKRQQYTWEELIATNGTPVVPPISLEAFRHGQSYGNRKDKKLFSGWADLELTEKGRS